MSMAAKADSVAPRARGGARDRILEAADQLAREAGPAHLALDAVAARAGVSKGGLLYHFPSKLDLLTALVDRHLDHFEAEIDRKRGDCTGAATLSAYLDASLDDCRDMPASGALAAMVQTPELLVPIRRFKRRILDRLTAAADDREDALLLFLAIEGLRAMKLLDLDILSAEENQMAVAALHRVIGAG